MYYKQTVCVAALSLTCLLSQASGHLEVDLTEGVLMPEPLAACAHR